ncbi:metalloregulator ArsR/SmtB family transcription factor [Microbacterium sp. HD4P20]|uniref:ArsR/SmtB family transcription factor n=1 Tax=Microbacterium sp. HD4P20 TaxID=2864874 RepID=UPI001C6412EC|nr:metalloregulator ArsR/SmtB family transcription factor [Microbacterium sp. HD4P20]MCP2636219.1 metalloregulator ArsR/SmtB family transcription factor [Microbacterium sp. HD4P20]
MHALDVLGDPVRRRILELLSEGEHSAGDIGEVVQREFGISQPAVSQHLRVLRASGFANVRPEGTRRFYTLDPEPLEAAAAWFDPFRRFWQPHLDALGTELARGRRQRRLVAARDSAAKADAVDEPGAPASGSPATARDDTSAAADTADPDPHTTEEN